MRVPPLRADSEHRESAGLGLNRGGDYPIRLVLLRLGTDPDRQAKDLLAARAEHLTARPTGRDVDDDRPGEYRA
ncbi:hypothetical protein CcI49_19890 [Frankia sp. CcI49]|nr:hypothetical protein ACG83_40600 [Frankia sp. R43]ONH58971.1 hypothetical protein CcI49_19890 [Frankia sp. CcI49]